MNNNNLNFNYAFVASTCADERMAALRYQVHNLGRQTGRSIWVAEYDAPTLKADFLDEPLKIVDRCLDEIERSKYFVLILDENYGSSIEYDTKSTPSSYIELELFQAVMHQKIVCAFIVGTLSLNNDVTKLLEIFSFALEGNRPIWVANHEQAFIEIENTLCKTRYISGLINNPGAKKALCGALAHARHRDFTNQRLYDETQFLDGNSVEINKQSTDLDLAESLIVSANSEKHANRKMSRVWLAMRSLMGLHYNETDDPRALHVWDKALRAWSRFAAWKGLHAHLYLGHGAAVGSLYVVRQNSGGIDGPAGIQHGDNVGGAFANFYYSLSKNVPSQMRQSLLDRSNAYVNDQLSRSPVDQTSGLLAIRGSINLRNGNTSEAIEDYKTALRLAEKNDHGDRRIGELVAELGWAEIHQFKFRQGRKRIEEGVRLMECTDAAPGFVVRGKRKLVAAHLANLEFADALMQAQETNILIEEYGLNDQLDISLKIAKKLELLLKAKH